MKKEKVKLFKENIKLVYYVVNFLYGKIKSNNYTSNPYIEKEDLVQEGLLGLFKAVKTFDPKKNIRFSTYAHRVIHGTVCRYIDKVMGYRNNLIIKPDTRRKCDKVFNFINSNDNYSSVEDISTNLYLTYSKVNELLKLLNIKYISIDQCKDEIIYENNYDSYVYEKELKMTINKLLKKLKEKEKVVIEMYFGLNKNCSHTLKEIGDKHGVSEERIRQIKYRALIKLKNAIKGDLKQYLKEYLYN
jgi:RNA polymerase sigma factor (sigma-70 family)